MSEPEKLEMARLNPEAKEIQDEAAARLGSQVYVWDGTKGAFFEPDTFVELKKRFSCKEQEVEGVLVAALTEQVKEPDWKAIHTQRLADSGALLQYYEKVALFRRHDKGLAKAFLVTYYERGRFVDDLLKAPGKYGNKTVKQFAKDLGVSESSVYLYQRFACLYQEKRVLEMSGREMTWSAVTNLLSLKSEKERTKLEDHFLEGKLSEKDLAAAVKKAKRAEAVRRESSGEKVDRRGGPGLSRLFDSTKTLSDKLLEKLSEFSEGYKAFHKLPDDDRKRQLKSHLKAAGSSLVSLHKRLSKMVGAEKPKEAGTPPAGQAQG